MSNHSPAAGAFHEMIGLGLSDTISIDTGIARDRHRSSLRPLKTGCLTLPPADLARYSISARRVGSTQATGLKAWLIGARGGSFTNQGFTVWFGADIAKAGLPARCTPHGLRKRCPLDIVSTTPAARR
jgi:hypothetical protein